ncbi:MAG: hypothetical protein GDA39_02570 [Hyphomonadaceae bacterium]|nr:hypothetical protein [Hyphomonadaceae bacterium]
MFSEAAGPFYHKRYIWLALIVLLIVAWIFAQRPVRIMLQTAPNVPHARAAQPVINIQSLSEWENETIHRLKWAFESEVYGRIPLDLELKETGRQKLPGVHFDNTATVETFQFELTNPRNGKTREFGLVCVIPAGTKTETPLIISQNFCPNHNVIPVEGIPVPDSIGFDCSGDGMISDVFLYVFGRYITTPPIAEIMKRGYGFAAMYPSEFVPDHATSGQAVLGAMFDGDADNFRPGALAAWAAQFAIISNHLKTDERFSDVIAYGHSRYGKTALISSAYNPNIDAVLAHQSGTGGASLSRNKPGETVADIVKGYPHWFGRKYAEYAKDQSAMPIDQHQLLALVAPRPVLLGNARRDVWSDPAGGFRAASGANPAYKIYGSEGLTAEKLYQFKPGDDLSFWIRPGTHGVVEEDWPAFLDFLDAHFR